MTKLLEIKDLSISFTQYHNTVKEKDLKVINDISLNLNENEILSVLGSSGSGKSLLAHAILDILPDNAKVSGSIKYKSEEIIGGLTRDLIKEFSLIPQSINFLNPLMKVKEQAIGLIENEDLKEQKILKQEEIFEKYGLKKSVGEMYPFQLSGGMSRKVLISTALLNNPKIIIADEPTPGLDIESVNETINDLINLKNEGVSILLITHDINVAIKTSDRIAILYLGNLIEITNSNNFLNNGENLLHPYTKSLYKSLPEIDFQFFEGNQPSYLDVLNGCVYQDCCPNKTKLCMEEVPSIKCIGDSIVRCHHI